MFKDKHQGIALITEKQEITYEELNRLMADWQKNIKNRCLIFILCTNTLPSIIGYLASMNAHIVPALIAANLDKELLQRLLELYRPKYLWLPKEKVELFSFNQVSYEYEGYVLLATGYEDIELHEDLALLMPTSGSTGNPKLVRQSYKNIRSNTSAIISYLKLTAKDRAITNLPMYYVYGLSIINTHLQIGGSIVVTEGSFFQREFWQLFKKYQVTNLGGVPYTYEMLDKLRFRRMELPSLRLLTQAGGKLSKELHCRYAEYAHANGKEFVVMYGAAEATARMGYLPSDISLENCGYIGRAIPGGNFTIIDEKGRTVDAPNIEGELVYQGPNVMLGYAMSSKELTLGDEYQGKLFTGDIAICNEQGLYQLKGRKNRFLKIFGKRVNLQDVEEMLREHFSQAMVCGGIDDRMYIFYKEELEEGKITAYLTEKLEIHFSAFKVIKLESFPQNEAGKILYKELVKYYEL